MTPDAAVLIEQKAKRQADNSFCFCHITASELQDLAEGYQDAWRKLGAIHELAEWALRALADHHLEAEHNPCVHGLLDQIEEQSRCA